MTDHFFARNTEPQATASDEGARRIVAGREPGGERERIDRHDGSNGRGRCVDVGDPRSSGGSGHGCGGSERDGRSQFRALAVAGLVFSMGMTGFGCSDDDDGGNGIDPDTPFPGSTPSSETMTMDTSDLSSGLVAGGICHGTSAAVAAWVGLNVVARLALPVATFDAAIAQNPTFIGDQTWRWTATGGTGVNAWTAELDAEVVSTTEIDWFMRVSGTNLDLDRFLWYRGTANHSARDGFWIYFDPLDTAEIDETVRAEWSFPEGSATTKVLSFENRLDGEVTYGDLLTYTVEGDEITLSFDDADPAGTTTIQWNVTTGEGQTMGAQGETCCWGPRTSGYEDIECP